MASVEDVKIPYEILIRFDADGLPKGAHAQFIRRVRVDGEMLKEEIGDAVPLDLEGFPTSLLMSDTARDALVEVTRLNAENNALKAKAAAAESALTIAEQRMSDLVQPRTPATRDDYDYVYDESGSIVAASPKLIEKA